MSERGLLLWLGLKSLLYHWRRTYSAIVGVALCVALIVTSTSVGGGFSYSSSQLAGILTTSPYLIVMNGSATSISNSRLTNATVDAITHPNILQSCPELYLTVLARPGASHTNSSITVRGAALDTLSPMKGLALNLSHPDSSTGAYIGHIAAHQLGVLAGDNITLYCGNANLLVECLQVFESNQTHDFEILLSTSQAQFLSQSNKLYYSLVELKLHNPALAEQTAASLEATLPGIRVIQERAMNQYVLSTTTQLFAMLWALGVVITIVMAVGVYYVMQNTVEQSVFEIAVLRALGSSRRSIMTLILIQALLIGVAAGILGVAMGVVLADAITIFVAYILAGTYIAPYYYPFNLIAAAVAATFSGVVGGLLPARQAAAIPPGTILQ